MSDLATLAQRYLAASDNLMSWDNDPESHAETYRQPGAGLYQDVQETERRCAEAFALAAGIQSRSWRVLRPAAYAALSAGENR